MRIEKHGSAVKEHKKECSSCGCIFYYTQNDVYKQIFYDTDKGYQTRRTLCFLS